MTEVSSSALLSAYRAVGLALRPLMPAFLAVRTMRGKEDASRRGERFGFASVARPVGKVVWVHGASLGETNAVLPLIRRLMDSGASVVFTSGTLTSARIAAEKLPAGAIHQFAPLDVSTHVDRFLAHWQPMLAVFAESELWPMAISRLNHASIPLVIANARLSERSYRGWARYPRFARTVFSMLGLVLARSEDDGARYRALGASKVLVSGDLKLDAPMLTAEPAEVERLRSAVGQRPVWVAASTHEGEETIVAEAHRLMRDRLPDLLTIVVPRHPERGAAVREVIASRRLAVAQRSRGEPLLREIEVYLADTLGELGLFYRVAPVAFLGGSLIPHGGQNPVEPARLETAVLHGPYVRNFADIYARLDESGSAAAVHDARGLAAAVLALLTNPRAAAERAANQMRILEPLSGALEATMQALHPFLRGAALHSP